MFEYKLYPGGRLISINPKYIVAIEPDGTQYTDIATLDGNSYVVEMEYDVVKQHMKNYLYMIRKEVS